MCRSFNQYNQIEVSNGILILWISDQEETSISLARELAKEGVWT